MSITFSITNSPTEITDTYECQCVDFSDGRALSNCCYCNGTGEVGFEEPVWPWVNLANTNGLNMLAVLGFEPEYDGCWEGTALDTVIQNMGKFLEEYHFARCPLAPLLEQAEQIYTAEAQRRAVDVRRHLAPVGGRPPALEISADHLQYAFNNLVHNAIKYSFRGGPDRPRYVRIVGQPAGQLVDITRIGWGARAATGTKPEYGYDACEFGGLWPGTYYLRPEGADVQVAVTMDGQGMAFVEFAAP